MNKPFMAGGVVLPRALLGLGSGTPGDSNAGSGSVVSGSDPTDVHGRRATTCTLVRIAAIVGITGTVLVGCTPSSPSPGLPSSSPTVANTSPTQPQPTDANTAPGADISEDGHWSGFVYSPNTQPSLGNELTFTVVNGAITDWQAYAQGECSTIADNLYLQGPLPIRGGSVAGGSKTPEAGGTYFSVSIVGAVAAGRGTGTITYVNNGCVDPEWLWTATRTGN